MYGCFKWCSVLFMWCTSTRWTFFFSLTHHKYTRCSTVSALEMKCVFHHITGARLVASPGWNALNCQLPCRWCPSLYWTRRNIANIHLFIWLSVRWSKHKANSPPTMHAHLRCSDEHLKIRCGRNYFGHKAKQGDLRVQGCALLSHQIQYLQIKKEQIKIKIMLHSQVTEEAHLSKCTMRQMSHIVFEIRAISVKSFFFIWR